MKTYREFNIKDFRNLFFRIFTIGYPQEGESILGVIDDGDEHLFSFVIDSYQTTGEKGTTNAILHILKDLKIPSIDAFIWTHPDNDHSVGVGTLLSSADADCKARIFVPAALHKDLKLEENAQKSMEYLFEHYNKGQKYEMCAVEKNDDVEFSTLKLIFKEQPSEKRITSVFHFLAPPAARLLRDACINKEADFNQMSIMFSVRINNFDYLFCGDLEGRNVKFLDKEFLQNIRFIKIPHHGSSRSKQLPELLIGQEVTDVISTTTTFAKQNLPKEDTINLYKSICEGIYSTDSGPHPYGCVETRFNIHDLSSSVRLFGNAKTLHEKRIK